MVFLLSIQIIRHMALNINPFEKRTTIFFRCNRASVFRLKKKRLRYKRGFYVETLRGSRRFQSRLTRVWYKLGERASGRTGSPLLPPQHGVTRSQRLLLKSRARREDYATAFVWFIRRSPRKWYSRGSLFFTQRKARLLFERWRTTLQLKV